MNFDDEKILEYIQILKLPNKFDLQILKTIYKKNVFIFHPDRTQDNVEKSRLEKKLKKINEAYENLKEFLEKNNGEYCNSNHKQENDLKNEENYNKQSAEDNILDKETEEFFDKLYSDEYFDEYLKHLNNDNEEDFEKYVKNLYKNLKNNDIRDLHIKADIEYYKEQKFNDNIGSIGCLLYLIFIIMVVLHMVFKSDILINIGLMCVGIMVILGFFALISRVINYILNSFKH